MSAIKNKVLKHFLNVNLIDFKKGKSKKSTISQIIKNVNTINNYNDVEVRRIWKTIQDSKKR